jgi:hypothetical protein
VDRQVTAKERFLRSLQSWAEQSNRPAERVLDPGVDVEEEVDRLFAPFLGRTSIPPP